MLNYRWNICRKDIYLRYLLNCIQITIKANVHVGSTQYQLTFKHVLLLQFTNISKLSTTNSYFKTCRTTFSIVKSLFFSVLCKMYLRHRSAWRASRSWGSSCSWGWWKTGGRVPRTRCPRAACPPSSGGRVSARADPRTGPEPHR